LTVTLGHCDDLGTDRHELAARELRSAAAGAANTERDLIRRTPRVSWATEHVTRHREEGSVVVQVAAEGAPEPLHGLSKQRECLWRYLEAQHSRPRTRWDRSVGRVADVSTGHQMFQLTGGLVLGGLQPGKLGVRGHHPGELPHRAPFQGATLQRFGQTRQGFESLGDTQLFSRGAWLVPEDPLHVLGEAGATDVHVRRRAQRRQQPPPLVRVRGRTFASVPTQRLVRPHPIANLAIPSSSIHSHPRHATMPIWCSPERLPERLSRCRSATIGFEA
jgi:hypothetical protein